MHLPPRHSLSSTAPVPAGRWQPDRVLPGSGDMASDMAPQLRWPPGRHRPGRPDAYRPQAPFQHQGEHGKPTEHHLWLMLHLAAGVPGPLEAADASILTGMSWVLMALEGWHGCPAVG